MDNKSSNKNLHKAKKGKNDEFYTQITDIEKELRHYKHHFKDKIVFCNCDDPRVSNFFHYFSYNFENLGLKKLITTCYKNQNSDLFSNHKSEKAIYLEYNGDKNGDKIPNPEEIGINYLEGDGDFRSYESIELLKQVDIVVTNPPFSLFREYISQLLDYDKKFLIIGNITALSLKETFNSIKENKMWLGYNCTRYFKVPDGTLFEAARSFWYTNLDIKKRHDDFFIFKTYKNNEIKYLEYDNYNAININRAVDIPMDYEGVMGVPITFLDKFNPEQFEIISSNDVRKSIEIPFKEHGLVKDKESSINGKPTFVRVLIKNKRL